MEPFIERERLGGLLLAVAFAATLTLGIAATIAARQVLLRLPSDFLDDEAVPLSRTRAVLRTIAGLGLASAGVALLVLPGPGLILIAIGLLMLRTRWRQRVVRSVVARPRVLRAINEFRRRHGRADLALLEPIGPR